MKKGKGEAYNETKNNEETNKHKKKTCCYTNNSIDVPVILEIFYTFYFSKRIRFFRACIVPNLQYIDFSCTNTLSFDFEPLRFSMAYKRDCRTVFGAFIH